MTALTRIAVALEQIADALARPAANEKPPEPPPLSDTDRAEAKRIARKFGLIPSNRRRT